MTSSLKASADAPPDLPIRLPIKVNTHQIAIATLKNGYLFARVDRGEKPHDSPGELVLVKLDATGKTMTHDFKPLTKPQGIQANWSGHMRVIDIVDTTAGPAVACGTERQGVLLLLNEDLSVRVNARFDQSTWHSHGFSPEMVVRDDRLGIAWTSRDNDGEQAFFRLYDLQGNPRTDAMVLTDGPDIGYGRVQLVRHRDGFVAVWPAMGKRPSRWMTRNISAEGRMGPIAVVASLADMTVGDSELTSGPTPQTLRFLQWAPIDGRQKLISHIFTPPDFAKDPQ